MKIETLERHGLTGQLVRRWFDDGISSLLPIQAEAVMRFGLIDGKSLVISGPGTSGKTFCGEMAAMSRAVKRQKAIFLLPLKAIAEEKYRLFRPRYAPLGVKIRLSTRDHTDDDSKIGKGDFDLGILIYEKFNALTSCDISLIRNTSVFIFDEFQLISDPKRGIELELAILKIRIFNPQAQIIILIGSGSSPERISKWLNLPLIEENRRPVDLRLGVLHRGTFHFRGFNDLCEGDEHWLAQIDTESEGPFNAQSLCAIKHLSDQNEQILIFTNSRKSSENMAYYLAVNMNLPAASESLKMISDIPPSIQNDKLERCLTHGVAFHNADLDQHQRQLVEQGFRNGDIKMLASTSTLAWGVNLPAKNVFIDAMKYSGEKSSNCREHLVPLTSIDYHQAAGRAGRLGTGEKYGRAIMTAESPYEHEILWDKYIYGKTDDPCSGFSNDQLTDFILHLVSCGAAQKPENIANICRTLYASYCGNIGEDLSNNIEEAVSILEKGGLSLFQSWGKIELTNFGKAASSSSLSVISAIKIKEAIAGCGINSALEWLFFSTDLIEWAESSGGYYLDESSGEYLASRLNEFWGAKTIDDSKILRTSLHNFDNPSENGRLGVLLFITEWISGMPTRDIEIFFRKGAGRLKRDALNLAWLVSAIDKLGRSFSDLNRFSDDLSSELGKFAERLRLGVDESRLPLAKALKIDREFIRRLYDFGIRDENDLRNIEFVALNSIVPTPVQEIIRKWREKDIKNGGFKETAKPKSSENHFESECVKAIKPSLVFTGSTKKMLSEVLINGKSIYLQPKLYQFLQRLWSGFIDKKPWVDKEILEPGFNQTKYISKLRCQIDEIDSGLTILSNGRGAYRLSFDLDDASSNPL